MLSTAIAVSCSSWLSISVMLVNSIALTFMPFLPCLQLKETHTWEYHKQSMHGLPSEKWNMHLCKQRQVYLYGSSFMLYSLGSHLHRIMKTPIQTAATTSTIIITAIPASRPGSVDGLAPGSADGLVPESLDELLALG